MAFNLAAALYPLIARDVFERLSLFGYPLGGDDVPPSELVQAIIYRVYYEQRCAAIGLRPEPWGDAPEPRSRYEHVT